MSGTRRRFVTSDRENGAVARKARDARVPNRARTLAPPLTSRRDEAREAMGKRAFGRSPSSCAARSGNSRLTSWHLRWDCMSPLAAMSAVL